MAVAVEMPKLGNTVEECVLSKWTKRPGERVSTGELLAEIETDKTTFELTAPVDGTLLAVFAGEGDLVPVFRNICVIGEPGEDVEPLRPREGEKAAAAPSPEPMIAAAPAVVPDGPSRMSPRARRFAREHDFRPEGVRGSGPGGRILEQDLREAFYTSPRLTRLEKKRLEAETASEERVSGIRERIARRMREALAATAQYTLHSSAGAEGLLTLRARIKAAGDGGATINDMVMFCVARALAAQPELNFEFADGRIRRHEDVDLGFACDTDRGLLVPVVRASQRLSLEDLAERVAELTRRAVEGTVAADDLAGATFTVSNLGGLGIESFTPILAPPQVAILGVGAITLRPVRRDGAIEFVDRIGLSLTCDHQYIDGAPGARFLQIVAREIESIQDHV